MTDITTTINQVFKSREASAAVACYASLRAALVEVDGLGNDALLALAQRADVAGTAALRAAPAIAAQNAVLVAYGAYLCAIVRERLDSEAHLAAGFAAVMAGEA
jgi:hypothetical protein